MVESANSVPGDDAAPPPVGPCIDPSNLAMAIFGAIFGTLLLCTAFALLIWYLIRTDKFQFADKLLVLERGLLGRRGGRTEAEGEEEQGTTKRTSGKEAGEVIVELKGRREAEEMWKAGGKRRDGRENGGRRDGRGEGTVEEKSEQDSDGTQKAAAAAAAGKEEEERKETNGRRSKAEGTGERDEEDARAGGKEATMKRMNGRRGTKETNDNGKEKEEATAEGGGEERLGKKEGMGEKTVERGREEEEEEKVESREEKAEKEAKKHRLSVCGRAKEEQPQMTNGHRIGHTCAAPKLTAEMSHNRRGEVGQETVAEEEEQKTHSARLMTVLSADQFGTLEMNRRRLETERRQLRELGVI